MSDVPLLALSPHCLPWRFFSVNVGTTLLSRTLASTFPAIESKVFPR